jgi:FAD/FMN-containing dehydrogenase
MQATVVVADGSVLTASDSENADLFWAIRGGGSNFGVGTEFVLKLHPQRRTLFAGMAVFDPAKLAAVSQALEEWHGKGLPEKEVIYVVISRGPDGKACIFIFLIHNLHSHIRKAVCCIAPYI